MGLASTRTKSDETGFLSQDQQKEYDEKNQMMKTIVIDKFVYSPSTCDFFKESKSRDPTLTTQRVSACRGKTYTAIAVIISIAILSIGIILALQSEFNQFLSADLIVLFNYISLILIVIGAIGFVFVYWMNRQYNTAVEKTYSEFR